MIDRSEVSGDAEGFDLNRVRELKSWVRSWNARSELRLLSLGRESGVAVTRSRRVKKERAGEEGTTFATSREDSPH